MNSVRNRTRGAAVLVMALMLPALAEAQTRVRSGFNMFSPAQDAQIGAQSAAQVDRQMPMVRSSYVDSYVDNIGQRLAAAAPGPRFNYQFRVVNASDLNAFALPGGYVYINRGVLEAAHSDAEVAGVLAHEISHVALRHGTHNASKAYLTQMGAGVLGQILGGRIGNNTAQVINVVGGLGMNALFLRYSREAESQADILGTQIMARAGYDPYAMASFFRTLQRTDHRKTITWLSDHPSPSNRIARVEQEAAMVGGRRGYDSRSSQLASVQSRLSGMGRAPTTEQIVGRGYRGR